MKKTKILYWSFTGLFSALFLYSSSLYLSKSPMLLQGFKSAGVPEFFIPLLGIAKLLGAVAILNPWFPKLREWAYAGFVFVLIGATWLHIATNTSFAMPLIFLVLLVVSYIYNNKMKSVTVSK